MSSGYRCHKCEATASSKCVNQRSVFPGNMLATMIGNMVTLKAVRRGSEHENWRRESDSDIWKVTLTLEMGFVKAQDEQEAIDHADFAQTLTDLDKGVLKQALCDHDWKITDGECMFGCCKA